MREISVSCTLTVYHDGQFWVGVFERVEGGKLRACRVVFGCEPSNEDILQLVCRRWSQLRFAEPVDAGTASRAASNPKRRQREAARELGRRGPSTKAQQALSEEREAAAEKRKAVAREERDLERQRRFELRRQKRKRRHRGR